MNKIKVMEVFVVGRFLQWKSGSAVKCPGNQSCVFAIHCPPYEFIVLACG